MDSGNKIRLGQGQQIIIAFDVAGMIGKSRSAKVGLIQGVPLNHRAHGPVQHGNAPTQNLPQLINRIRRISH